MSVTNYTPTKGYKYNKLKNCIYLVDATHTKDIKIDNGEAYISDLSQTPLKIEGFNITFKEEESLDERYKFNKTVTISVNGYANFQDLGERYYCIIETSDGTFYLVNVDFPSKVTHTFNLSDETNQTDFTFQSQSNYPTLKLNATIPSSKTVACVGYINSGIIGLRMICKDYVAISTNSNKITTYGDTFKTIEYLGKTCTFSENYDGEKYTDTLTFDIALDNYQTSWHYNLLEFIQNLYSAIISVNGTDYKYYSGFNYGLQPQVSIDAASTDAGNNSIRITLVEASEKGLIASNTIEGDESSSKSWRYIKTYEGHDLWECVSMGKARYLVKQEIDALGNPTNRYMCLNGYQSQFPYLNIIGTFSATDTFYNPSCGGDDCSVQTNLPDTIYYDSIKCNEYNLTSSCNWTITEVPYGISVYPLTGNAATTYYITVCNTIEPSDTAVEGQFKLTYGNSTKYVRTVVQKENGFIHPSRQNITCNAQVVEFYYDPQCPITITSIASELSYELNNGTLIVNVPKNQSTTQSKTWNIVAKDCHNQSQTVYIIQDKVYEKWVDTPQYLCVAGSSYVKQMRYTGDTPTTIDKIVFPEEYRAGALIKTNDPRCTKVIKRWTFFGNYYCLNGNKIKALEQEESGDEGLTWRKTGITMLGQTVETQSSWCLTEPTYSWQLTDLTQCGDDEIINYTFEYCSGQKFMFEDVPSSGGTYTYCLRSLANDDDHEWVVSQACDYVHITPTDDGYKCVVDENFDVDNDRECYIILKQLDSGNRVTLNVMQKAGELQCDALLDSCCGRGSEPYDIELGAIVGASESDSILEGCTIRMTTSLPSWLKVTMYTNYVVYETLEHNEGSTRYFEVKYEKVSGPDTACNEATVLVRQLGGQAPTTEVFRWLDGTIYKDINPNSDAGSQTLALMSTIDGVPTGFTVEESCDWINVIAIGNTGVTVSYTENTTEQSRTCRITLLQLCASTYGNCRHITLQVNQSAGSEGDTYFRWGDDLHPYEYSTTINAGDNFFTLVPFVSKILGENVNATLTADCEWIQTYNQLYYNYNEVRPDRNESIYVDTNYTENERTGLLTLNQKGTSDKIRVYVTQPPYIADCTITTWNIAEEVCIGDTLDYTFSTKDARCMRTTYFNLFQGSNVYTSTATPQGGVGSGFFMTSDLSAGTATATCVVNGSQITKTITIKKCYRLITLNIKNNTSSIARIKSKITIAINNPRGSVCYEVITPVDTPSVMNINPGSTITFNDVYIDARTWTRDRNFCDVENCAAYRQAYPNLSNVILYDENNNTSTYIPQTMSPSTPILDGVSYTININS